MNKIFGIALGILAAIGGFVDIGDLVFNVSAGATFGYQLLWVVVIGVVGIIVETSRWVSEHGRRLLEPHPVLLEIRRCLALIPRELEIAEPKSLHASHRRLIPNRSLELCVGRRRRRRPASPAQRAARL